VLLSWKVVGQPVWYTGLMSQECLQLESKVHHAHTQFTTHAGGSIYWASVWILSLKMGTSPAFVPPDEGGAKGRTVIYQTPLLRRKQNSNTKGLHGPRWYTPTLSGPYRIEARVPWCAEIGGFHTKQINRVALKLPGFFCALWAH